MLGGFLHSSSLIFLLYILRILWGQPPVPQNNDYMLIQQTSPATFWFPKTTWQQTSWNGGDHRSPTCWLMGIPKSKQYIPFQTTWLPDVLKKTCKNHRISPFQRHQDLLIWEILDQKGLGFFANDFLCANHQEINEINLKPETIYQHLPRPGYCRWLYLSRVCCKPWPLLPRFLPSSESSASVAPSWG